MGLLHSGIASQRTGLQHRLAGGRCMSCQKRMLDQKSYGTCVTYSSIESTAPVLSSNVAEQMTPGGRHAARLLLEVPWNRGLLKSHTGQSPQGATSAGVFHSRLQPVSTEVPVPNIMKQTAHQEQARCASKHPWPADLVVMLQDIVQATVTFHWQGKGICHSQRPPGVPFTPPL